jgi:hypothetical protein
VYVFIFEAMYVDAKVKNVYTETSALSSLDFETHFVVGCTSLWIFNIYLYVYVYVYIYIYIHIERYTYM